MARSPDFSFVGRVAVEIGGDRQRSGEQERRVDRGQFALPDAAAGFDVEEMIEEALVSGGVGLRALRAFAAGIAAASGDLRRELRG